MSDVTNETVHKGRGIERLGLVSLAVANALLVATAQSLLCLAYVTILVLTTPNPLPQWTELPTWTSRNRVLSICFLVMAIGLPYVVLVPVRFFWSSAKRFSAIAIGSLGGLGALVGFLLTGWAAAWAVFPALTSKYAAPLGLVVPAIATLGGIGGGFMAALVGSLVRRAPGARTEH